MNNDISNLLKSHVFPFSHLSEPAFSTAAETLRIFPLCDRERIIFPAIDHDDCLLLVKGAVDVATGDEALRIDADAAGGPYRFPPCGGEIAIEAVDEAVICRGNSRLLEDLLALDELGQSVGYEEAVSPTELLLKLRDTKTFRTLPMENAYQALQRMSKLTVSNGEEVVRQYEEGDAYYIITEGSAEVWREDVYDEEPVMVAELGPGDAFGEESLVMQGGRNATVKMVTDGEILKLEKNDFDELISTSMIEAVTPAAAQALVDAGSRIVDVRYAEEYEKSSIPGSVLIPLPEIRARIDELDKDVTYLVLCKKGSRAAAAALLLKQRGIKAMVIAGGIDGWTL